MSKPSNGKKLTVAALAEAKRLPVDHLLTLGLRDTPRGVEIPYCDAAGNELFTRLWTALVAKEGSRQPSGVALATYGTERIDKANKAGFFVAVKGESDCWVLWYHNIPALGIPGVNAATVILPEHVEAVETIYFVVEERPDGKPDQSGEQFRAGVLARLSALDYTGQVFEIRLPDGVKDPTNLHGTDPKTFKVRFEECKKAATPVALSHRQESHANDADAQPAKPTQAEQLLRLADAAEYVHTADGKAFALVTVGDLSNKHVETLPLRSVAFRDWLAREYYRATGGKAVSGKIAQDVLNVLTARARFDGAEREVSSRVGAAGSAIFLDLCTPCWETIAVDPNGWRVVRSGSPLFRRSRGMLGLPLPVEGGELSELRPFVNVGDDDWPLIVAWLLQALNPRGPYPICCLHGEQGAAKSTTARVLRSLIDPSAAPLRSGPRDERDLVIAANNSWMIALDNLSHLEPWLSDALCRLSTGGGFGTRELYTNDEEIMFDAQRPMILTGIEDLATRGDLMDRSLLIRLPRIEEESRQTEAVFWQRFEAVRPRILGALLTALSGVLRELPRVQLARPPRMADFAAWAVAAETALGWKRGTFLAAYAANRGEANRVTLDASLIFPAFEQFVEDLPDGKWAGTWQALLDTLNPNAGDTARSKYWPATPRALSGQLRRLAPTLRTIGIVVQFDQRDGSKSNSRLVLIERERSCKTPSEPSEPSEPQENTTNRRTVSDGCGSVRTVSDGRSPWEKPTNHNGSDGSDGSDGEKQYRSPSPNGIEEGEL